MRLSTTTRTAAAIAGGLALAPGQAAAPRTLPPPPAHVRPASQPASAPATQPKFTGHELELHAYRLTMKGRYDDAIARASEQWGQSPFVLRALLEHESKLRPKVINPDTGAAGIGQMTAGGRYAAGNIRSWRTGVRQRFTLADALDPWKAIPAAAEMLTYAVDVCRGLGDGVAVMLAWYNTGKCRAQVPGFVTSVVRIANRLRMEAGLPPMPAPEFWWRRPARRTHAPES